MLMISKDQKDVNIWLLSLYLVLYVHNQISFLLNKQSTTVTTLATYSSILEQ